MKTSFQLQFSLYELHRIENCLCVIKLSLAHFYVEVSAVLKILDKTFNHMHPNSSTFECTKFEAEMDFISMSCSKSMRSSYASNRDIWRDSSWHFLKLLIRLCGDARHTSKLSVPLKLAVEKHGSRGKYCFCFRYISIHTR